MSLIVSNFNAITNIPLASNVINSNLNTKPILYPLEVSSVTYGIDQLFKTWEEEKYLPSTTSLGRAFDWLTGWTKDENGSPQPSIFGRVMNLFSKTKSKKIKEVKDEPSDFIPDGEVLSYTSDNQQNIHGRFQVEYFQEGCSSPSSKNGNWDMRLEVEITEEISGYTQIFYGHLGTCLSNSMLNDYFKSVSEYCHSTEVCGCPNEEKIFSYLYTLNGSSLKVYNSNTLTSQILFPNQDYPSPNQNLILACYDESINFVDYRKRQDATGVWLTVGTFSLIGGIGLSLIICAVSFTCCCKKDFNNVKKDKFEEEIIDNVEMEELQELSKEIDV